MDRRSFFTGLLGLIGAAATVGLLIPTAEATPLNQLRNLVPLPPDDHLAVAPDGTEAEDVQYWRRQRRRYWRRGGRVCRTYWDRWGRPFRRCYWRGW